MASILPEWRAFQAVRGRSTIVALFECIEHSEIRSSLADFVVVASEIDVSLGAGYEQP